MRDDVIEESGDFRVRLVLEEYPEEPEDEYGCPVFFLDYSGRFYSEGTEARFTGYGKDVIDAQRALDYFGQYRSASDTATIFERWLSIFHDGNIVERHDLDRDGLYLAYNCRELTTAWGFDTTTPVRPADMSEWAAYVEGDVYGYVVERKVDQSMTDYDDLTAWVEVDSCWGYYGSEYAEESAREALAVQAVAA